MESILAIDLKNNPEILDDFEGMSPGDKVKITAEFSISELSENRASLPLDSVISVTSIGGDDDEDEYEDEEEATDGDEES
jgi:hypothetical protein